MITDTTRVYFVVYCLDCKFDYIESETKQFRYFKEAWPDIMAVIPNKIGRDVCPICQKIKGAKLAWLDFIKTVGVSIIDPVKRQQYKPSEVIHATSREYSTAY